MKKIRRAIPVLIIFIIFIIWIKSSYSLPVELHYFTAQVNKNNVNLIWGTFTETNNAGFHVERKNKNDTLWVELGFVAGNGTTNKLQNYSFDDLGLSIGIYFYRLKQEDFNGEFNYYELSDPVIITTTGISTHEEFYANKFTLFQNYPNPFNPVTKITYELPFTNYVTLKVYDNTGREVATLVDEKQNAGSHSVEFDGSKLASGTYFYEILTDDPSTTSVHSFTQVKKMILVK